MSELLSDAEVCELTKPIKQGAAQVRHLSAMFGSKVKRRPDGKPVVTKAMLASLQSQEKTASNETGLNWGT